MTEKIIIGLAGKIASGKETVGKYLIEKSGAKKIRFSDPLRQILDMLDLPDSRQNMQTLSTIVRQNFDENILAKAMMKLVSRLDSNIIIIDGVRRETDIENFRQLKNFFLIYIDASGEKRYERCVKRNENPGDSEMTREEFNKKDDAEAEEQIESLKKEANFVVDNNGSFEDLYRQIENILSKIHATQN
jgi:dephospho-CoA kinase